MFCRNGVTTVGHTNRVFAVKWHPSDINITLSGGWDNTIQVSQFEFIQLPSLIALSLDEKL